MRTFEYIHGEGLISLGWIMLIVLFSLFLLFILRCKIKYEKKKKKQLIRLVLLYEFKIERNAAECTHTINKGFVQGTVNVRTFLTSKRYEYIWLVGVYGIPNLIDYLMPNPVYAYISNAYYL